jgi:hypothetical protein
MLLSVTTALSPFSPLSLSPDLVNKVLAIVSLVISAVWLSTKGLEEVWILSLSNSCCWRSIFLVMQ